MKQSSTAITQIGLIEARTAPFIMNATTMWASDGEPLITALADLEILLQGAA